MLCKPPTYAVCKWHRYPRCALQFLIPDPWRRSNGRESEYGLLDGVIGNTAPRRRANVATPFESMSSESILTKLDLRIDLLLAICGAMRRSYHGIDRVIKLNSPADGSTELQHLALQRSFLRLITRLRQSLLSRGFRDEKMSDALKRDMWSR